MVGLNDLEAIGALDREGMRLLIHRFPDQCRQGWETGGTVDLPPGHRDVDKVILAGMGGSAIVGDALADYLNAVESVDEYAKKAKRLGAVEVMPKTPVKAMGWFAMLKDTEGNVFGIWQTDPKAA